ncbi:50S ribosomal protein L22 [Erysipelothrix rhusiopathiae]|nr:50S ribosomal protein L22 [Erysipelothrix rhusiopathiae]MDE8074944.1 50S ribosomal protein L22 [Erysipelothrix rhusiopathiae]MDE8169479.1 50S ribosomal protein L22 [Erysipelothrix rhusiopathiae]MDE8170865.1 50S ribosomal protein L22 [Erysipelothrix rhusiopathiae]MDE8239217.1 50S ribosomal protein L22 [Erysipelothrix rhusiopathiae]
MEVKAIVKTVRVTPRKARLVLDEIRGLDVDHAAAILRYTPNSASKVIAKVLDSAIANATNNHQLDEEKLYISACYADESVTMKRFRPRAKGSAAPIMKRTSHITVVVSERA